MKKLFVLLFISVFIFAGCKAKANPTSSKVETLSNTKTIVTSNEKIDTPKSAFQSVKPVTVPQLSQTQKSQIDDKFNTVLNNINSSLDSLDEVKDINLNSVN